MSTTMKFRTIGSNSFIEVNITGECSSCDNDYVDVDATFTVNEVLKLAADIIDNNPYYKELFNTRIF